MGRPTDQEARDTPGGEDEAFSLLLATWPNRRADVTDIEAYRALLGAGFSAQSVRLGAERFSAWLARSGKTPGASLAWFLRLDGDGRPNSFIASAEKPTRRDGAGSGRHGQEGPYTAEDLRMRFDADEGAWDISTPGGYSARIYPPYPLARPDADRSELAEELTRARGGAWRTFVGATEEDVDFSWSDSAAWGGCWVAKAPNGFQCPMNGPSGTDRKAGKPQLLAEFNSGKPYRLWVEAGGAPVAGKAG